jgi:hypothetical protein
MKDCLLLFRSAGTPLTEDEMKKKCRPPIQFQSFLKLWKTFSHEETRFLMQNINSYMKKNVTSKKKK